MTFFIAIDQYNKNGSVQNSSKPKNWEIIRLQKFQYRAAP